MKICSISLVKRAIQIKITVRYNSEFPRITKIKKVTIPRADEDTEQLELPQIAGGNTNDTATLENILAISYGIKYKLNI